jgi:predicted nucleotidyltransferase component of viral defense system
MSSLTENVIERAKKGRNSGERLNFLRESLHHLLLQEADRKGAFSQICFLGGTALRIIFGLDRFSEDLDFSASPNLTKSFQLEALMKAIERSLQGFEFDCAVEKLRTERNVQSCFFSFKGILHQMDRSFRTQQKLAIKFDVDCRPPAGAVEVVSPITGERVYKVRHYDLSSLFAGKLHALLYRVYTKGRDLYDFLWYAGRQTKVNGPLLENAIEQTEGMRIELTDDRLRELLLEKFKKIDFEKAKKDVAPFLANPESISLFEESVFTGAVQRISLNP